MLSSSKYSTLSVCALLENKRSLTYSPFDSVRKPPKGSKAIKHSHISNNTSNTESSSSSNVRIRDYETSDRLGRPTQSAAQTRKEAEMLFPETLPSGRYKQQNTIAQQIKYADPEFAKSVYKQRLIDKEYVQKLREIKSGKGIDSRFYKLFRDYREINDPDPYATLFGESAQTSRIRTAAWQRQFEEENAGVWLPYERTGWFARHCIPNKLLGKFIRTRDRGGTQSFLPFCCFVAFAAFVIYVVKFLRFAKESDLRPITEIR